MDTILILVLAIAVIVFMIIGYLAGKFVEKKRWEAELDTIRGDAVKRSRSVLTGTFSEQIAPYLPGFRYSPTEIRFIGKPVDFIVFEGMDGKEIKKITFVEVKSGKANLNPVERSLRDAIQAGKIGWEIYRPPQDKEPKEQ
jgi:predicted Holliday junction resolvase-like endonuclease